MNSVFCHQSSGFPDNYIVKSSGPLLTAGLNLKGIKKNFTPVTSWGFYSIIFSWGNDNDGILSDTDLLIIDNEL